eukprot:COSAG02_NODE_50_length_44860_cov_203.992739_36_plen_68_part_00
MVPTTSRLQSNRNITHMLATACSGACTMWRLAGAIEFGRLPKSVDLYSKTAPPPGQSGQATDFGMVV